MDQRVLVTAGIFNDEAARGWLELSGIELVDAPAGATADAKSLIAALQNCTGVIAGPEPYTEEVFTACPNLHVVSRWGVGYDAVDIEAACRHHVLVQNTPGVITDAVADLAFMFIMALARGLRQGDALVRSGGWRPILGQNVGGATIGIVGLGTIGACTARRAKGFGMKILATDPMPRPELVDELGVEYVELEELLGQSDFVVLHCNASAENCGLFSAREFNLMKATAYFINVARGSVVEQSALYEALTTGQIAGAGLDVYAVEPPPADDPLLQLENCVFMPHTATMDKKTIAKVSACVADNVLSALVNGPALNVVNR